MGGMERARVWAAVAFSFVQVAKAGGPGEDCTVTARCDPGAACIDGRCLCEPDYVSCGEQCVSVDDQESECNRASFQALPMAANTSSLQRAATFSSVFRVGHWTGANTCLHSAEAHPERAAIGGDALFFVAYNLNNINWARPYNVWSSSNFVIPSAPNHGAGGDPTATTSDFTGLNYVAELGNLSGVDRLIIAATSSDNLDNNSWTYPFRSIDNISTYSDGSAIEYDIGGTDLWAANWNDGGHRLRIMKNCKRGAPGCCVDATCTNTCAESAAEQCPVTWNAVVNSNPDHFPALAVNPCTHSGVLVYRRLTNNEIRLQIRTPDGVLKSDTTLRSNQPLTPNTDCAYHHVRVCSAGGVQCAYDPAPPPQTSCSFLTGTPQIATTSVAGRCYAAVAWDAADTATDGKKYFYIRWQVWDITSDSAPFLTAHWLTKDPTQPWNHYGPTIAATGPYIAVFRYDDFNGACANWFAVHGSKDLGAVTQDWGVVSATSFPAVKGGTRGYTEFNGTISRAVLEGGGMFATWVQPVCMTTGPCSYCPVASCSSGHFSYEIKGRVVTP